MYCSWTGKPCIFITVINFPDNNRHTTVFHETIVQTTAILFLLSLYARNRIVRNVTVSAARREIQIPFNPNNFASITAQITIATIPLRNDPTIAIFGSSTAEKYATSTTLIPATINPRKYRRSPVCA